MLSTLFRHATPRRWFDLIVYATVAAFAFEILLPIGIHISKRIPVLDAYAPWLLLFGCYGLIFAVAFVACEAIRIRAGQWQFTHLYPPLWLAVALALVIVVAAAEGPIATRPLRGVPDWTSWFVLLPTGVAVLAAMALRQIPWAEKRRTWRPSKADGDQWEWKTFAKWFGTEEPAQVDYFRHSPVSGRIVQALLDRSSDQSVALLGPFGGGKTTILERARAQLEDSDSPVIVIADFNAHSRGAIRNSREACRH